MRKNFVRITTTLNFTYFIFSNHIYIFYRNHECHEKIIEIHDKSTRKCRQTPNVFDEDTTKNQTR